MRFTRSASLALLTLGLALGAAPVAADQPDAAKTDDLVTRINRARVAAGALPLARSPELDAAAHAHSADMVEHDYLDHTGSDGSEPQQRADRAGYHVPPQSGWIVVEVISAISGDPQGPVDWWLNDDPAVHGKVVLNPRWREVGAGYAEGGEYGHYWTALFGCRPGVVPSVTFEGETYTSKEECGDPGQAAPTVSPTLAPTSVPTALPTPLPPTTVPTVVVTPTPPRLSATTTGDGSIQVSWSDIARPSPTDWIGVYSAGAADSAYTAWAYVDCATTPGLALASGTCRLPIASSSGTYEVRLFGDNGYTRLASSSASIPESRGRPSLSVSTSTARAGGVVNVRWSDISTPAANDWIGLYRTSDPDTTPLTWMYVGCADAPLDARALGSCNVALPTNLSPGTYEFRVFARNGYQRLAVASPIDVSAS